MRVWRGISFAPQARHVDDGTLLRPNAEFQVPLLYVSFARSPLDATRRNGISRIRPKTPAGLKWFADQPSFHAAIEKRCSRKTGGTIGKGRSFDDLFACGDVALEPITGLGALFVNDAFLRLDAESNLFPHTV